MSTDKTIPRAPNDAQRFARLLLGVGVSIPISLAPLLGKLSVPLFPALLDIIPVSIQGVVIPLSAAAMSIVALVAEAGTNRNAPLQKRKRLFIRAVVICSALLAGFTIAYSLLVTRVNILDGARTVSFVTGLSPSRHAPCENWEPADCIARGLTFRDTAIDSYFGDQNIKVSSLIIELLYVGFFAALGFVVACLMDLKAPPKMVNRTKKAKPDSKRVKG
jgi:hypothetical protein